MPVVTQAQIFAFFEAWRAATRSPWLSSVLTLLANTMATTPVTIAGKLRHDTQHRKNDTMVTTIDQIRWLGTVPEAGGSGVVAFIG